MTKTIYQIRQIIPNEWDNDNKSYGKTQEFDSFNAVKKFLSTKNNFKVGAGSDIFRNNEIVFHTSNFDDIKSTENKALTLKNVIENFREWGGK